MVCTCIENKWYVHAWIILLWKNNTLIFIIFKENTLKIRKILEDSCIVL